MPARLGSHVVDALLLGPEHRRRQVQDFPILGDVWSRFADEPGRPHDLLIIPTWEKPTGAVAEIISDRADRHNHGGDRSVAYLQDLVAASLMVEDLPEAVLPATAWWDRIQDRWQSEEGRPPKRAALRRWIEQELLEVLGKEAGRLEREPLAPDEKLDRKSTSDRMAAKIGLLLGMFLVADHFEPAGDPPALPMFDALLDAVIQLGADAIIAAGAKALSSVIRKHKEYDAKAKKENEDWKGAIFQVTLNREAESAVVASVPAIKADAARQLFSISCKEVSWAVIDSGIDQTHPAFQLHKDSPIKGSRIKATYDFRRIRRILGIRSDDTAWTSFVEEIAAMTGTSADAVKKALEAIGEDRRKRMPIDWRKVEPLIKLENPEPPENPHGTHVAGIIGADWREEEDGEIKIKMQGVCPDIMLYDFRVLGSDKGDSEFAVSAALQFIRYLNVKSGFPWVHGVNMSLAIRHNVRNYACGRTPVCIEAESLVASGVVVVAAAGNRGYQAYQLADSTTFESYAASSITDPGNAEGVITVGSTHRHWPHTYGVSFFSGRGPTGDGRLKPDLLAPGERIASCVPGEAEDEMDGTSMATPHVSGAAALLMARHQELKGRPGKIKQILCETATDLGRERSFQGHGMVDVLRAIQSI